ncbi:MAG: adenylosuccinate lyase [candidate division KSB1 bacterium]|nr:adenylosuccinate lyase [candidate division KSB1 bacterium]MDZ7319001.1 adenylosuccinate lyase [candidate division KSB1 bacterium]MDZ7339913.1 adenylosuccinate lyase [candidate division KSB1 bacterium]
MIERYSRPRMAAIWTDENKFQKWLEVEICVCEVQAELGLIPTAAVEQIRTRAQFNKQRILDIEREVKHDVIAFLTNVGENVGDAARYIHLGMTSSDLLDTAMALLLREAGEIILEDMAQLRSAIRSRALEHKYTVCIGRSHGVHAEPTTFGLKLAVWYDEVGRHIERLRHALATIAVGKVSGAVGTFAHLDPIIEERVCQKLGLRPAPASTQIIQRDRYAEFLTTLALIGSSIEKFATEIRNLQRTEILEVEEFFSSGQKGSSAMPHKRNPVSCEQLCGLSRVLRANALASLENISLWHERDITHSSVERIIIPDSTILIDYMLQRLTEIIRHLLVYPDNMRRNLERMRGLIFSQMVLLALTRKGMAREIAYRLVQQSAMEVWQSNHDFKQLLLAQPEIMEVLTPAEIENCFDLKTHLRNVDKIFERVGIVA